MPKNFTQISSLPPHCHSSTCRAVQLWFLVPVSCSLCFCVDPSLLANAAGPGCCSEADGRGAGCDTSPTYSSLSACISLLWIRKRTKIIKKGSCEVMFMGQLQKFYNYFLVCGGVGTDPCKTFVQDRIEPTCPYLGLPPSSNNRKIRPRFCQNLHEKALSNVCNEDKTPHFSFTHPFWSNLVHFIVLVSDFLLFRK